MQTVTYTIPNISCHHCGMTIEMELSELPGVKSIVTDTQGKQTTVHFEPPADEEKIKSLLAEINYPPAV